MTLLTPQPLKTKKVPFNPEALFAGWRYMMEAFPGMQEGVIEPGGFKVTQRGAGANMSVDVAAGAAWVRGDDTARQGVYQLVNDATVNVAVDANSDSRPRIDHVVARVFDSSISGSTDTPLLDAIPGSPSTGAQGSDPTAANYLTGAPAIPNGAMLIATITVPGSSPSSITNAMITDRRRFCAGMRAHTADTAGPTYSQTGDQLAAITAEFSGRLVEVTLRGSARNGGTDGTVFGHAYSVKLDNASEAVIASVGGGRNGEACPLGSKMIYTPSAGRHKISLHCNAGTNATWGLTDWGLYVRELQQVAAA